MKSRGDSRQLMQQTLERIVLSMTMQESDAIGNLSWTTSLLRLAEHAAEENHVDAARAARELAERLSNVESIYESEQTTEDVARRISALRRTLAPDAGEGFTADAETMRQLTELLGPAPPQVPELDPCHAEEVLQSFRRLQTLMAFLKLLEVSDSSHTDAAGHPDADERLVEVPKVSREIHVTLDEIAEAERERS